MPKVDIMTYTVDGQDYDFKFYVDKGGKFTTKYDVRIRSLLGLEYGELQGRDLQKIKIYLRNKIREHTQANTSYELKIFYLFQTGGVNLLMA